MTDQIPDELLMQQILNTLNRGPMTLAGLRIALGRDSEALRKALGELIAKGKVEQRDRLGTLQFLRTDRYRNDDGGPGPEAA